MIRRVARCALALSGVALASLPLAAAARAPGQDGGPFIQDEPRAMARVAYFNQAGLQGEYLIEYGKPAWKPEYDKEWDKLTRGKRLRLGRDWWTSLNTFCALDPEPLRKQRFDAFGTEPTKGGTKAALKHELEIRFGRHRLTTSVQPKL